MVFCRFGLVSQAQFKLKLSNTEHLSSTYSTGMWPPTRHWQVFLLWLIGLSTLPATLAGNQPTFGGSFKIHLAAEILVSKFCIGEYKLGDKTRVILVFFLNVCVKTVYVEMFPSQWEAFCCRSVLYSNGTRYCIMVKMRKLLFSFIRQTYGEKLESTPRNDTPNFPPRSGNLQRTWVF